MELEAVDVIDRKIVDQLRIDGRRSFGAISRYVGLTEASVRARYQRLKKLGVVQVVGMTDSVRAGEASAHVGLNIRGSSVESVARILAQHPEIKFIGASIGTFDLSLDIRCPTHEALGSFIGDTLRSIPGIDSIESATVLEVLKDSYLWAGFREQPGKYERPHPQARLDTPNSA